MLGTATHTFYAFNHFVSQIWDYLPHFTDNGDILNNLPQMKPIARAEPGYDY